MGADSWHTESRPAYARPAHGRTERELKELKDEFDGYLDQNAQDLICQIRADLRAKWDKIIIMTGKRGVGKSTLAQILAKLVDYSWGFDRMAYEPEHIMPIFNRMAKMGPYRSMIMDEGGEIWNRSDWATKVSKTITKQVIGDRWLYSARFILAPSIFHLDRKAIDMADLWIKVYSPNGRTRGYAEVRAMQEQDYYNNKLPYAPPFMDLRFDDLPEPIAYAYEQYKIKMGKSRSEKYQEIIDEETGNGEPVEELDLEEIYLTVFNNADKFTNDNTGRIDWRLVYGEYNKQGLGQERAKTIASRVVKAIGDR